MSEHRLSETTRSVVRVVHRQRLRRIAAMSSEARFTPAPRSRKSLSTRGQPGESWRTKKHTPSRLKDIAELRGPA